MKKAAIGMLVVMALSFGPVPMGESARVSHTGCITRFEHRLSGTGDRVVVAMRVGNKLFIFQEKMGKIKQGGRLKWITSSVLAAWEPVLAQFRAAAVAKVKVRLWYDDSSKWVKDFFIQFNQPC